ncbi:MAG: sn-glycerol-3-phosphate ABC transporter ATP-binding protein UgpC [Pseudomonadota bacterium]
MSKVELTDLRKNYGRTEVVHGIDLAIAEGEFVVLVGPSGCGKSTVLRMIAGLEEISGGTVAIDGRVVNNVDPKGRNVAMVFQNYALYPHMTARENIGLNLRLAGMAKAKIAQEVARAAKMLDIEDLLDRRPAQLSGGQRQRVAMGRAMVRAPSVFLFDEPLSNLDAKLRVQMRSEIKNFHRNAGATSIYVTHDQVEAMTLADRVAVMNGGRVEQAGDPLALYETPQNVFVAGFIGSPSMNLVEAPVGEAGAEIAPGWHVPLPPGVPGGRVVVGIRPEHMGILPDGQPGTVTQVEITGAQTALEVDVGGRHFWVMIAEIFRAHIGETVPVGFDPAMLHVFDAASGQRIAAS